MRKLTWAACLAIAAAVVSFSPPLAQAGEPNNIGCIWVADGGTSNNATTGYGYAPTGLQAFDIAPSSLLTIQAGDTAVSVAVGSATTDAGRGLYLAAHEKITTSTGPAAISTPRADGGANYVGGVISIAQPAGVASSTLCVYQRNGTE